MKINKLGYILLATGIGLIFFAIASDYLGIGKKGIQAAQLLLIQIGILLSVTSLGFFGNSDSKPKISNIFNQMTAKVLQLPATSWILLGFFIIYIFLFITPNFFNSDHRIAYLTRYIPEIAPIGRDLNYATSGIQIWLSGKSFYDLPNLNYPPLYAIIFSPFLLLSYPTTYIVMTVITLFCIVISGWILPSLILKNHEPSILLFFFLTVVFSYGMQFELERGQFNVFAFTLGFLAIYIYHYHNQFHHLAYLLLSVAIQLKLYPAILVVMLIRDWRDWKGNLLRFTEIGIINIVFLLALGGKGLADFFSTMRSLVDTIWIRPYNHSLSSYVSDLTSTGLGVFRPETVSILKEYSSLIKIALVLYYAFCLIIVIRRAIKNKEDGLNPNLFLICTIGMMILPSLSIDYKLPLLSPAIAMALAHNSKILDKSRRFLSILLLIAISLAYSLTLFSFVDRPLLFQNCFPLFMAILTGVTLLNIIDNRQYPEIEFRGKTEK